MSDGYGHATRQDDANDVRDGVDDVFALGAGLYAAVATAAPVLAAVHGAVTADDGLLYVSFLAWVAGTTVAVAVPTRRRPDLAVRLGGTRLVWGLVLLPALIAGAAVGGVFVVGFEVPSWLQFLVAMAATVGGLLGFVLGQMAVTRTVAARVAAVSVLAEWRAGWPPGARRRARYVAWACAVAGAVTFVAAIAVGSTPIRLVGQFLAVGAIVVLVPSQPAGYRASELGIERRRPLARSLVPWDAVAGYTATEEAIVVRRREPWRLDLRWDRAAVEDPEALLDVLDRYAPAGE